MLLIKKYFSYFFIHSYLFQLVQNHETTAERFLMSQLKLKINQLQNQIQEIQKDLFENFDQKDAQKQGVNKDDETSTATSQNNYQQVKSDSSSINVQVKHEQDQKKSIPNANLVEYRPFPTLQQIINLQRKVQQNQKVVIDVSGTKYESLQDIAENTLNWTLLYTNPSYKEDWNICWYDTYISQQDLRKMYPYQKINHFPGSYQLGRKNLLGNNLAKLQKHFPQQYSFFPKTWLLPIQYEQFKKYLEANRSQKVYYISKPEASCQGRGIFITQTFENFSCVDQCVVQEYIKNPFLIDGLKFDFRVYVLIKSVNPLKIFIYQQGLARLATVQYQKPSKQNSDNLMMHLTNYAVNKRSPNFIYNQSEIQDDYGHKRSFTSVLNRVSLLIDFDYQSCCIKWVMIPRNYFWKQGKSLLRRLLLLILSYSICTNRANHETSIMKCVLKYLGMIIIIIQIDLKVLFKQSFDVMLDEQLKPWLLEVNHTPSFTCDSPLDVHIKKSLLLDTLLLQDISLKSKIRYNQQRVNNLHGVNKAAANNQNNNTSNIGNNGKFSGTSPLLRHNSNNSLNDKIKPKLLSQSQLQQQLYDHQEKHKGAFVRAYPAEDDPTNYKLYIDRALETWNEHFSLSRRGAGGGGGLNGSTQASNAKKNGNNNGHQKSNRVGNNFSSPNPKAPSNYNSAQEKASNLAGNLGSPNILKNNNSINPGQTTTQYSQNNNNLKSPPVHTNSNSAYNGSNGFNLTTNASSNLYLSEGETAPGNQKSYDFLSNRLDSALKKYSNQNSESNNNNNNQNGQKSRVSPLNEKKVYKIVNVSNLSGAENNRMSAISSIINPSLNNVMPIQQIVNTTHAPLNSILNPNVQYTNSSTSSAAHQKNNLTSDFNNQSNNGINLPDINRTNIEFENNLDETDELGESVIGNRFRSPEAKNNSFHKRNNNQTNTSMNSTSFYNNQQQSDNINDASKKQQNQLGGTFYNNQKCLVTSAKPDDSRLSVLTNLNPGIKGSNAQLQSNNSKNPLMTITSPLIQDQKSKQLNLVSNTAGVAILDLKSANQMNKDILSPMSPSRKIKFSQEINSIISNLSNNNSELSKKDLESSSGEQIVKGKFQGSNTVGLQEASDNFNEDGQRQVSSLNNDLKNQYQNPQMQHQMSKSIETEDNLNQIQQYASPQNLKKQGLLKQSLDFNVSSQTTNQGTSMQAAAPTQPIALAEGRKQHFLNGKNKQNQSNILNNDPQRVLTAHIRRDYNSNQIGGFDEGNRSPRYDVDKLNTALDSKIERQTNASQINKINIMRKGSPTNHMGGFSQNEEREQRIVGGSINDIDIDDDEEYDPDSGDKKSIIDQPQFKPLGRLGGAMFKKQKNVTFQLQTKYSDIKLEKVPANESYYSYEE